MDAAVSVVAMVRSELAKLPESSWTTFEAAAALSLAHSMDTQTGGAAASKEIDRLLAKLKGNVTTGTGDALNELAARREKRRGA
jgi:hypothetical protein